MWYIFLWIFSLAVLTSAILVISSERAINAIISLILAFINSIALLIILGVDFLALIYCIVYVGAIAILFLFVVFLLAGNTPQNELVKQNVLMAKGLLISLGLLYILTIWCAAFYLTNTGFVLNCNVASLIFHNSNLQILGIMFYKILGPEVIYTIGLILLTGIIGSIVLTIKIDLFK